MIKLLVSSFLTALVISIIYFLFEHSLEKAIIIFVGLLVILIIRDLIVKKVKDKKNKPN
ncbi:TPA: hypothetical protein ACONWM_002744 [Staphylococcus aureus]